MAWTSKTKAIAFASLLVLLSATFLATAAASAGEELRRNANRDSSDERSATRHGVALGVVVREFDSTEGRESLGPAEGATVKVFRITDDNLRGELVQEKATDADGRALFQLRRGGYRVAVGWGDSESSHAFRLQTDTRAMVAFDEEGNAHWGEVRHREMDRRGDMATVGVRIGVRDDSGNFTPAGGAKLKVIFPGTSDRQQDERSREATADRQGVVILHLHKGEYGLVATYGDHEQRCQITVSGDMRVHIVMGEGCESMNHPERGDHAGDRPHDTGDHPTERPHDERH